MIFKVYNVNHQYVDIITEPISPRVEENLKTGTKTLSFSLPLTPKYIEMVEEEGYIETADYSYIIKEIEMNQATQFTIYCKPNLEDFTGTFIPVYDIIDATPKECITKIIEQTDIPWVLDFKINYPNLVQYQMDKVTALECFTQIANDFNLEYWFDTKNKKLTIYAEGEMGRKRSNILMNDLRLASLSYDETSYDFATILYPYGYKGLSIRDINNGKEYIENYQYCNKKIAAYYINEDIKYAEDLKRIAEEELKKRSTPLTTFRVQAYSLPPNLSIGDSIYVIDKLKQKKSLKRVVKIVHYLTEPEKDIVELDNEIQNISKMFYQFQDEYRQKVRYIQHNIAQLQ